jgi:hypothetical protein
MSCSPTNIDRTRPHRQSAAPRSTCVQSKSISNTYTCVWVLVRKLSTQSHVLHTTFLYQHHLRQPLKPDLRLRSWALRQIPTPTHHALTADVAIVLCPCGVVNSNAAASATLALDCERSVLADAELSVSALLCALWRRRARRDQHSHIHAHIRAVVRVGVDDTVEVGRRAA